MSLTSPRFNGRIKALCRRGVWHLAAVNKAAQRDELEVFYLWTTMPEQGRIYVLRDFLDQNGSGHHRPCGQWKVWQQAINENDRQLYPGDSGLILSDPIESYAFDSDLRPVADDLNNTDCRPVIYRRKSTWQVEAGALYCVDAESNRVIGITAGTAGKNPVSSPLEVAISESFNWVKERLIYSEVTDSSSDLMLISIGKE